MRQLLASKRRKEVHRNITVRTFTNDDDLSDQNIVTFWVHGTGQNPLLRKLHMSPLGLMPVAQLPEGYGLKRLGLALSRHDGGEFPFRNLYAFGWSGKLSFKARLTAGEDLARAIIDICDVHEQRFGKAPRIRVVSHSHGCNVTLNASDHLQARQVVIEEVVFLACPVQYATAHKIGSSVFKEIYALYSSGDILQVMDPQGLKLKKAESGGKFFSERRFEPQSNLVQAQVWWKNSKLTHVGFVRERFGRALPSILAELRATKHEILASDDHEFILNLHDRNLIG